MLKSLYIKALNNRRYLQPEPEKNSDFSLKDKWFDKPFVKSKKEFSIAAGDGSFNIKKWFFSCRNESEALYVSSAFSIKRIGFNRYACTIIFQMATEIGI